MFRYSLDVPAVADVLERAVSLVLDQGLRTADIMPPGDAGDLTLVGTDAMADAVAKALEE